MTTVLHIVCGHSHLHISCLLLSYFWGSPQLFALLLTGVSSHKIPPLPALPCSTGSISLGADLSLWSVMDLSTEPLVMTLTTNFIVWSDKLSSAQKQTLAVKWNCQLWTERPGFHFMFPEPRIPIQLCAHYPPTALWCCAICFSSLAAFSLCHGNLPISSSEYSQQAWPHYPLNL